MSPDSDKVFESFSNNDIELEADRVHIDIFFQSPWFIKYQSHMRFTFVELLGMFNQGL